MILYVKLVKYKEFGCKACAFYSSIFTAIIWCVSNSQCQKLANFMDHSTLSLPCSNAILFRKTIETKIIQRIENPQKVAINC
jgi:hypothetical protein